MSCFNKLNKKAIGWPYVVGLIIGLVVLIFLLFIMFKGKNALLSLAKALGEIFG